MGAAPAVAVLANAGDRKNAHATRPPTSTSASSSDREVLPPLRRSLSSLVNSKRLMAVKAAI
jgi:hypothetical protein